jgi:hypothetical protein
LQLVAISWQMRSRPRSRIEDFDLGLARGTPAREVRPEFAQTLLVGRRIGHAGRNLIQGPAAMQPTLHQPVAAAANGATADTAAQRGSSDGAEPLDA